MPETIRARWEAYVAQELSAVTPLLTAQGITLDATQVHTLGERYLMLARRDVGGGGLKLILTGLQRGTRVIVKVSRDTHGIREIERERTTRNAVRALPFSYHLFSAPKELWYHSDAGLCISVTEYIEQDAVFIERPVAEQFSLILSMLKMQEAVHAATYEHARQIKSVFGLVNAAEYTKRLHTYVDTILRTNIPQHVRDVVTRAHTAWEVDAEVVEQYAGFLTHADFVPHNFRIRNGEPYLLDYASLHFGNKHEGWARCMNFMMLYTPDVARALETYMQENRSAEEYTSLWHMRIYKLLFLITYYCESLPLTDGPLEALTRFRITFWGEALASVLSHTELDPSVRTEYQRARDALRDSDEHARQHNLH